MRAFPSSDALGDEENKSNLLVYCTPEVKDKVQQTPLVFFGLYLDEPDERLENFGMYCRALDVFEKESTDEYLQKKVRISLNISAGKTCEPKLELRRILLSCQCLARLTYRKKPEIELASSSSRCSNGDFRTARLGGKFLPYQDH